MTVASTAINFSRAASVTGFFPSEYKDGRRHLYAVPEVSIEPASALSVSYRAGALADIGAKLDYLVAQLNNLRRSGPMPAFGEVFVDAPPDFSYASALPWEYIEVEIVDEAHRVFRFDDDEHLNYWS